MPTNPSKSKRFLIISFAALAVLVLVWIIFRTQQPDTGTTQSNFLKNLFSSTKGNSTEYTDQTTIPHGHGEDTPRERLLNNEGGVAPSSDGPCNLFMTGIVDNDCDGIPNWLEERNGTGTENPNSPYHQGAWNHDGDTIFHGMDGHYACDAYNNKLLNCEKNISSEIEAVTDSQDTDEGGVPDVMEIIKGMNPLEPCDDHGLCTKDDFLQINTDGENGISFNFDDDTFKNISLNPGDDPNQQIQLILDGLENELEILTDTIYELDPQQNGETELPTPIDFNLLETYTNQLGGLQGQLSGLQAQLEVLDFSTIEGEYENNPDYEDMINRINLYAENFLVFSQSLNQYIINLNIPYEGWLNRQSVKIDIDLETSSFRDGKMRMHGYISTNGLKNLPVKLRYTDVSDQAYSESFLRYCSTRTHTGFQQTDIINGNNFLADILTILNSLGRYQSADLVFEYVNPQTGAITYSDRATTNLGERIPFSVSIDGLNPAGLYTFALVDPTLAIPIAINVTTDILGQPITINTGGVINIPVPDPANVLSSFIFSGPSCFDYLNRFIPAVDLDIERSTLERGTETNVATATPEVSSGGQVENGGNQRRNRPRGGGAPSPTAPAPWPLLDGNIRDGVATIIGKTSINTTTKLSPFAPQQNGAVMVPIYARYGSPLLEMKTPTLLYDVSKDFKVIISGVHQDDWFALYDGGTGALLLGPHQFSVLNTGVDRLSKYEERWYYIASFAPPTRSYYYTTREACLADAHYVMGYRAPCYTTALKSLRFNMAVPMGVENDQFEAAVTKITTDNVVGTRSFVGQTKFHVTGTVDTRGNDVELAVDMVSIPYVTDTDGVIEYPNGQDLLTLVDEVHPGDFVGGVPPVKLSKKFFTLPDSRTTIELPLSTFFAGQFQPGYLYVYSIQDARDPHAIYFIGSGVTFLKSPDEIGVSEFGTTTLTVDPELVVGEEEEIRVDIGNDVEEDPGRLWNPLDMANVNSIPALFTHVFKVIVKLVLPLAGLLVVYLAFLFITAGNNPKKRETAYNTMIYMGYGLGILLVTYILGLVMESVIQCLAKGICV